MLSHRVPVGSMWLVLSYTPCRPISTWPDDNVVMFSEPIVVITPTSRNTHLATGTMLFIGKTVKCKDSLYSSVEFVEIVAPCYGWINRFFFNSDSAHLKRIA